MSKDLDIPEKPREIALPSETIDAVGLISDDRIREILSRFSPILHRGIAESNTFFKQSTGDKLSDASVMTEKELGLWGKFRGIVDKTVQSAPTLFVPAVNVDSPALPKAPDSEQDTSSSLTPAVVQPNYGKAYRVNLDEVVRVPLKPLDVKDMKFLVRLNAHMGGRGGAQSLYNAFIALDTFAVDSEGRWVVRAIPGTNPGVDGPDWMDGPSYGPYSPAGSSLWFNTRVDETKPNSLSLRGQGEKDLMLHCDIHRPEELEKLEIPQDPQLRFFFWQLDAFISDPSLGRGVGQPELPSGSPKPTS